MNFATKVVSLPIPPLKGDQIPSLEVAIENILPNVLSRNVLSYGVQHKNLFVKWTTIVLIRTLFLKLEQLISKIQEISFDFFLF